MSLIPTLIWGAVVFIPVMTAVVWLAPSARRAIAAWTAAHIVSAGERDATVQQVLADVAERRHKLAVAQALVAEETAAERARLEAETEQHRIGKVAAGKVLGEAVEARKQVIAARAAAEVKLAPDAARAAMGGREEAMRSLEKSYAVYCDHRPAGAPLLPFGQWVGTFRGLSR